MSEYELQQSCWHFDYSAVSFYEAVLLHKFPECIRTDRISAHNAVIQERWMMRGMFLPSLPSWNPEKNNRSHASSLFSPCKIKSHVIFISFHLFSSQKSTLKSFNTICTPRTRRVFIHRVWCRWVRFEVRLMCHTQGHGEQICRFLQQQNVLAARCCCGQAENRGRDGYKKREDVENVWKMLTDGVWDAKYIFSLEAVWDNCESRIAVLCLLDFCGLMDMIKVEILMGSELLFLLKD